MKINPVTAFIAIATSLLLAYGFHNFHNNENNLLLSIGSFIGLSITLLITLGVKFELSRTRTNIRVVSGIFFGIVLSTQIFFSVLQFSHPLYIISNGIIILVYLLIVYSLYSAKQ